MGHYWLDRFMNNYVQLRARYKCNVNSLQYKYTLHFGTKYGIGCSGLFTRETNTSEQYVDLNRDDTEYLNDTRHTAVVTNTAYGGWNELVGKSIRGLVELIVCLPRTRIRHTILYRGIPARKVPEDIPPPTQKQILAPILRGGRELEHHAGGNGDEVIVVFLVKIKDKVFMLALMRSAYVRTCRTSFAKKL